MFSSLFFLLLFHFSCQDKRNSFSYYNKVINSFYDKKIIKGDSITLHNNNDLKCVIYSKSNENSISFILKDSLYGHRLQFVGDELKKYSFFINPKTVSYEIDYHPQKGIRGVFGSPFVDVWINFNNSRKLIFSEVEYDSLIVSDSNSKLKLNMSTYMPFTKECDVLFSGDKVPIKIDCFKSGQLVRTYIDTIK